jgi:hypothetical protein
MREPLQSSVNLVNNPDITDWFSLSLMGEAVNQAVLTPSSKDSCPEVTIYMGWLLEGPHMEICSGKIRGNALITSSHAVNLLVNSKEATRP